jgi:uncharacterized protein (TIGR02246 family)
MKSWPNKNEEDDMRAMMTMAMATTMAIYLLAAPERAAAAAGGDAKDQAAIQAAAAAFGAAWQSGDARAFAQLFTDDGQLVSPVGDLTKGRAELEKAVAAELAGPLKGTTHKLSLTTFHFVSPGVAVVDGDVELLGVRTPAGQTLPPLKAKATGVVVKVKVQGAVRWLFSDLRGYVFMPRPPLAAPQAAAAVAR